eukprot:682518-Rhodomonas_salina.4
MTLAIVEVHHRCQLGGSVSQHRKPGWATSVKSYKHRYHNLHKVLGGVDLNSVEVWSSSSFLGARMHCHCHWASGINKISHVEIQARPVALTSLSGPHLDHSAGGLSLGAYRVLPVVVLLRDTYPGTVT